MRKYGSVVSCLSAVRGEAVRATQTVSEGRDTGGILMYTRRQNKVYSAHQEYYDNRSLSGVYDYNPAADGPEYEVIKRILASHPTLNPCLPSWLGKVPA
jgi:hypothetical protein